MRAAVLEEFGSPLVVREVELPRPGPREARVRVRASGVCHSDLSLSLGRFGGPVPVVPGHEGAGIVEEVGSAVTGVAPGDRVIVAWQAACRRCRQCLAGQPQHCTASLWSSLPPRVHLDGRPIASMNGLGTFADALVIDERCLVPFSAEHSFDVAALVGCAVMTGVGAAVNTAHVRPGDSVVVIGCGGVGLSAIQGARLAGAGRIVAVEREAAKVEQARRCGAADVVTDPDQATAVLDLLSGGADRVLDCVGLPATLRLAFDVARPGGDVVMVGIGPLDAALPLTVGDLLSGKSLRYSRYGGADVRRDFPRILEANALGRLELDALVDRHIRLDEVNDALEELAGGKSARAVVRFD